VKYLLDTDTVSYFLRGNSAVRSQMLQKIGQWGISTITYSELAAHQFLTSSPIVEELLAEFLKDVDTVAFESADALEAGRLAARLKKAGTPIGAADTLIAGHALSIGVTLVSNNLKHFSKVPGLKLANWAE
jgi:tRNA(fMet)-specific endonuclease VapC